MVDTIANKSTETAIEMTVMTEAGTGLEKVIFQKLWQQ